MKNTSTITCEIESVKTYVNGGEIGKFVREIFFCYYIIAIHWQKYTVHFHARPTHDGTSYFLIHRGSFLWIFITGNRLLRITHRFHVNGSKQK